MSHDLRTPLNAMLGFAQLLDMDNLTADQRESVTQILEAGRHLLDLMNEVLDISSIESGNLSLSPEPVAVRGGRRAGRQADAPARRAAADRRQRAAERGTRIVMSEPIGSGSIRFC